MKYTISTQADKKVQEDANKIIQVILKYWKPKAIVMFGGFGHGGGSFKKKNNKIIPLNDYDLYVITNKPIKGEKLEKVGEECSHVLGKGGLEIVENYNKKWDENKFFHVDLHNVTLSQFSKLYPTQRTADLKTSIVIWGDKNILKKIPDKKISKSDAIRLLFNKLNHFQLAENNSIMLKNIYAVKGFTDLTTSLLIYYNNYSSKYQDRLKTFKKMSFPQELKQLVEKATLAKLYKGYEIRNTEKFFESSKKWVLWTLKKILKEHLDIKSKNWEKICKKTYKKLPYIYFNDYLGSDLLFFGQYYLNIKFFLEAKRKGEFLPRSLIQWRDAGLIVALSLILFSVNEKKQAEKYLKKLTKNISPLRERILKLYSIYYLQKLV